MRKIAYVIFSLICSLNSYCQINESGILEKVAADFDIRNIDSLIGRIAIVNKDIENHGILFFPEERLNLLTGYSYGEFYDWDLYFENIYLSYFGVNDYCFTNLKAFLKRQHRNGFVSRTLKEPRPYQHFKPFLAQIALLGSKQRNDFLWLTENVEGAENKEPVEGGIMNELNYLDDQSYYMRLKAYINFWFWYQDFDKNGLPVWNSSDHSGMDNQTSRSGKMNAFRFEGVDLACYLYRELISMSVLAEKLKLTEDSKMYEDRATDLIKHINEYFWDERDEFYYDRDEQTGEFVRVKSVAGFFPLFIGAASRKQAEQLVINHLTNKSEFWTDFPLPAYAKTEPDYDQDPILHGECNWRGTAWVPTNYMIFHGLLNYGYMDIAKELAGKTFKMAFDVNKTLREYYNAETGKGKGLDPFWGWSTLAYFMPFEYELGYNPTDLNNDNIIRKIGIEIFNKEFHENRKSEYNVFRLADSMKLDGNWDKPQWQKIKSIEINNYMGNLPKYKPNVQARMMYDVDNIYVIFHVKEAQARCLTREINGPVWEDSCVEFFFSPDTLFPQKYFNLEINCGGIPLMHYNAQAKNEIVIIDTNDIQMIESAISSTPDIDRLITDPVIWSLEFKLPMKLLEKYSRVVMPDKGVVWRANCYKIAHKSPDPHYISWSFVDTKGVDMHLPHALGQLKFQ